MQILKSTIYALIFLLIASALGEFIRQIKMNIPDLVLVASIDNNQRGKPS